MRRRKGRIAAQSNPFESFLDVVCNLIGVLLLLAIVSALAIKENVYDVETPVEQKADGRLGYLFAATPSGIYPLEKRKAAEKLETAPVGRTVETRYFEYIREPELKRIACSIKNRPAPVTENNISDIMRELQALMEDIYDTDAYFVCFNVSPDEKAFRLFRAARNELWKNGVQVGWIPLDPLRPIVFMKGGLSILPQG